jgi:dGTPase
MEERITLPSEDEREYLRGRIHEPEKQSRWRSDTQRDYDRLLYSSAFQRLGGITQVTPSETGRPFHTRLTHTLKVAQVARRSAERLKQMKEEDRFEGAAAELVDCLNVDATEAGALAHDIGHPPFGHVSEVVLSERASEAGGFEGNAQSFRVVTRLAMRSGHPGLDLTRHTLNAMLKYPWLRSAEHPKRGKKWGAYSSDEDTFKNVRLNCVDNERSLEACLMDWADDVTYAVHDADDFARAGLIPLDRLALDSRELDRFCARLQEYRERQKADGEEDEDAPSPDQLAAALKEALAHVDLDGPYEGRRTQRVALRSLGSMLITHYIEAVTLQPDSGNTALLLIDNEARLQVAALKELTMQYVVRSPSLAVIQAGQTRVIERLWDWYYAATAPKGDRRLLPPPYRDRLRDDSSEGGRRRLVTDLVASLTESAAMELHRRMSGTSPGSVLDAAAINA